MSSCANLSGDDGEAAQPSVRRGRGIAGGVTFEVVGLVLQFLGIAQKPGTIRILRQLASQSLGATGFLPRDPRLL